MSYHRQRLQNQLRRIEISIERWTKNLNSLYGASMARRQISQITKHQTQIKEKLIVCAYDWQFNQNYTIYLLDQNTEKQMPKDILQMISVYLWEKD